MSEPKQTDEIPSKTQKNEPGNWPIAKKSELGDQSPLVQSIAGSSSRPLSKPTSSGSHWPSPVPNFTFDNRPTPYADLSSQFVSNSRLGSSGPNPQEPTEVLQSTLRNVLPLKKEQTSGIPVVSIEPLRQPSVSSWPKPEPTKPDSIGIIQIDTDDDVKVTKTTTTSTTPSSHWKQLGSISTLVINPVSHLTIVDKQKFKLDVILSEQGQIVVLNLGDVKVGSLSVEISSWLSVLINISKFKIRAIANRFPQVDLIFWVSDTLKDTDLPTSIAAKSFHNMMQLVKKSRSLINSQSKPIQTIDLVSQPKPTPKPTPIPSPTPTPLSVTYSNQPLLVKKVEPRSSIKPAPVFIDLVDTVSTTTTTTTQRSVLMTQQAIDAKIEMLESSKRHLQNEQKKKDSNWPTHSFSTLSSPSSCFETRSSASIPISSTPIPISNQPSPSPSSLLTATTFNWSQPMGIGTNIRSATLVGSNMLSGNWPSSNQSTSPMNQFTASSPATLLGSGGTIIRPTPVDDLYTAPIADLSDSLGYKRSLLESSGGSSSIDGDRAHKRPRTDNMMDVLFDQPMIRITEETEPSEKLQLITLKQYQKQALTWMLGREESDNSVRGGILADEMGMGKTIEMLSLILTSPEIEEKTKGITPTRRPTLIICPVSLLGQWKSEIQKHTLPTTMSVYVYHGPQRNRDYKWLRTNDIVLTTYTIVCSDCNTDDSGKLTDNAGPLFKINWLRIVLDEAHIIKEAKTRTAKAACLLKAERRWCMTGTPIQNSLEDLFSLFHFLQATNDPEVKRLDRQNVTPETRRVIEKLLLRRTKQQRMLNIPIVPLPVRIVRMRKLEFSKVERDFYDEMFTDAQSTFDHLIRTNTLANHYSSVLVMLLRLRQACNHPLLVINSPTNVTAQFHDIVNKYSLQFGSANQMAMNPEDRWQDLECLICLEPINEPGILKCGHFGCTPCLKRQTQCPMCSQSFRQSDIQAVALHAHEKKEVSEWKTSTKIEALMQEIGQVLIKDPLAKAVVFSQWTSMLNLIEMPLDELGISYVRLDGTMPQSQREENIEEFRTNSQTNIFLISLKVGGIGLNLAAGYHAYIIDPWWNPAVEQQAIDRLHRLGQVRPVMVTRFIINNSIEERILKLQQIKEETANRALRNQYHYKRNEARKIRIEDLRMLFGR